MSSIQPYIIMEAETGEPQLFSSTKQIMTDALQTLDEWSGHD